MINGIEDQYMLNDVEVLETTIMLWSNLKKVALCSIVVMLKLIKTG